MRRFLAIFQMLLFLSMAFYISPSKSVAGVDEEALYQEARSSYYELSKSARMRKYRDNWIKVIEKYK